MNPQNTQLSISRITVRTGVQAGTLSALFTRSCRC